MPINTSKPYRTKNIYFLKEVKNTLRHEPFQTYFCAKLCLLYCAFLHNNNDTDACLISTEEADKIKC